MSKLGSAFVFPSPLNSQFQGAALQLQGAALQQEKLEFEHRLAIQKAQQFAELGSATSRVGVIMSRPSGRECAYCGRYGSGPCAGCGGNKRK